jgi:TonB family protein
MSRRLNLALLISTVLHAALLWIVSGWEFGSGKGGEPVRRPLGEIIVIRRYMPSSWITPHIPFGLSKLPIAPPQRIPDIGRPFEFIPFLTGAMPSPVTGGIKGLHRQRLMLGERPSAEAIPIPIAWGDGTHQRNFGMPGFGWGWMGRTGGGMTAPARGLPIPEPLRTGTLTKPMLPPIPAPAISKPGAEFVDLIAREYAEFAAKVRERIEKVKRYPEESRERGEEGKVELAVFLDGEGRVGKVEISRGCGYPALEKAAVDAVMNAQPFPIPERLRGHGVWISVAISFKIEPI